MVDDAILVSSTTSELQIVVAVMGDDYKRKFLRVNTKKSKIILFEIEKTRTFATIMVVIKY